MEGQVQLGRDSVDIKELLSALKKERSYIQLPSGKWAKITEIFRRRLEALEELFERDDQDLLLSPGQMPDLEEEIESEGIAIQAASDSFWALKKSLKRVDSSDLLVDDDFKASLRPYQLEGYRWLHQMATWQMGVCLADDMGLGKTIQTLAVLQKHRSHGPSLVVAPLQLPIIGRRSVISSVPISMYYSIVVAVARIC